MSIKVKRELKNKKRLEELVPFSGFLKFGDRMRDENGWDYSLMSKSDKLKLKWHYAVSIGIVSGCLGSLCYGLYKINEIGEFLGYLAE